MEELVLKTPSSLGNNLVVNYFLFIKQTERLLLTVPHCKLIPSPCALTHSSFIITRPPEIPTLFKEHLRIIKKKKLEGLQTHTMSSVVFSHSVPKDETWESFQRLVCVLTVVSGVLVESFLLFPPNIKFVGYPQSFVNAICLPPSLVTFI
jgi:hypothetical protein